MFCQATNYGGTCSCEDAALCLAGDDVISSLLTAPVSATDEPHRSQSARASKAIATLAKTRTRGVSKSFWRAVGQGCVTER